MTYTIEGLDPSAFRELFALDDTALGERGIHRLRAESDTGFPCRITLEDAPKGETLLLLNHESRGGATPYRARHAIFVREAASAPARYVDEVPPVMHTRRLSLRGFDAEGMMVDALISEPGEADAGLRQLFANPTIDEIDVHNATRGCFSARARRG